MTAPLKFQTLKSASESKDVVFFKPGKNRPNQNFHLVIFTAENFGKMCSEDVLDI
jgi:hypothetical protein